MCKYCKLNLEKTVYQQLQSDLQAHKVELNATLPLATDLAPPANHNEDSPTLATKLQCQILLSLREQFNTIKTALDSNPRSYAQVTAGLHSRRGRKSREKVNQPQIAQTEAKVEKQCQHSSTEIGN